MNPFTNKKNKNGGKRERCATMCIINEFSYIYLLMVRFELHIFPCIQLIFNITFGCVFYSELYDKKMIENPNN